MFCWQFDGCSEEFTRSPQESSGVCKESSGVCKEFSGVCKEFSRLLKVFFNFIRETTKFLTDSSGVLKDMWGSVIYREILASQKRLTDLKNALVMLSPKLDATYEQYLSRIPEDNKKLAYCVLSWVALAHRPMTLEELQYAIAIQWDNEEMSEVKSGDLYPPGVVLEICVGLIMQRENRIVLTRE